MHLKLCKRVCGHLRLMRFDLPSANCPGIPTLQDQAVRSIGFRLVYEGRDKQLLVVVVVVGKRERSAVQGRDEYSMTATAVQHRLKRH